MNSLFIDTSNSTKIIVRISKGEDLFEKVAEYDKPRADVVISLLQKVLEGANISLEEIDSIQVKEGPGSYTGLRVGVSIANALSFTLQKKVNDKDLGEYVVPVYE